MNHVFSFTTTPIRPHFHRPEGAPFCRGWGGQRSKPTAKRGALLEASSAEFVGECDRIQRGDSSRSVELQACGVCPEDRGRETGLSESGQRAILKSDLDFDRIPPP